MSSTDNTSQHKKKKNVTEHNEPTSLQNKVLGFAELWTCLAEYVILLAVTNSMMQYISFSTLEPSNIDLCSPDPDFKTTESVFYAISCTLSKDYLIILLNLGKTLIRLGLMFTYIFWRYRALFFDLSRVKQLPKRFGLNKFTLSWKFVMGVVIFQILDFFAMFSFFKYMELPIFSFDNYLSPDKQHVDYFKSCTMLLLSPFQEEIIFRGLLTYILYRRHPNLTFAITTSNILFGSFHLINFFGNTHSKIYVILQVILGIEIGLFYSYRFIASGTLWESIILHIINNMISSFLPSRTVIDLTDPLMLLPLIQTALFYLVLMYISRGHPNLQEKTRTKNEMDKLD